MNSLLRGWSDLIWSIEPLGVLGVRFELSSCEQKEHR